MYVAVVGCIRPHQAEDIFLGDFVRSNGVRLRGLGVVRPVKKGERFYCEPHACLLSNTTEDFVSWRRGRPLTDKACTSRQRMSLFMADPPRPAADLRPLAMSARSSMINPGSLVYKCVAPPCGSVSRCVMLARQLVVAQRTTVGARAHSGEQQGSRAARVPR